MARIPRRVFKKIQLAKLYGITSLELYSENLTYFPEEILELTNLTKLNLSNNQLNSLPESITQLSNLAELHLSNNKLISLPKSIGELTNLIELRLKKNRLNELPKSFGQMKNLKKLYLNDNKLTRLPESIDQLHNLIELFLMGNQLNRLPESINQLSNLTLLDLDSNQLSNLPKSMSQLINLTRLYLSGNRFNSIPKSIIQLTSLNILNMNYNQFDNLPKSISQLSSLEMLGLEGNRLISIPESIGELTNLVELNLKMNKLDSLPKSISQLTNLKKLHLKGNPLKSPPLEITSRGMSAIKSYFGQKTKNIIDPQPKKNEELQSYEAKVLVIGEGGAGKTSLCRKILNPNYKLQPESKDSSTEGIDIFRYTFPFKNKQNFKLNLWDFGGQEIYHSTHQFFLTKRSLYLLVTDSRKNDTDLSYWLNVQELLAEDSPLFIIQNEKQNRVKDLDSNEIRKRFANVKGFYHTNLLDNRGLVNIVKTIELEVQKLPHIGTVLPEAWAAIRKALEKKEVPYISLGIYFKLCAKKDIYKEIDALVLSQYLHDIGVILHFQDDPILERLVILDNKWGTEAVYKVVDNEKVKRQKGKFEYADLSNIWSEDCYQGKYVELLALMQKFKLCYRVPNTQTYIAPILLPVDKPQYKWNEMDNIQLSHRYKFISEHESDKVNNIQLRYRYKFMPKGILTRFIVEMNQDIKETEAEGAIANQLVWKTGVVLEREGTLAQVLEVYGEDEIRISIKGALADRLRSLITYQIDRINKTFHNLKVEKLIPCNCATCSSSTNPHFFEESNLLKRQSVGKRTIECQKEPHYYDVKIRPLINNFALKDKHVDFKAVKEEGVRLVGKGKLKEVFDLFESRNTQSAFVREMSVHRAKWSHLENAKHQGTLEQAYYLQEITKTSEGLIALLSSETDLERW